MQGTTVLARPSAKGRLGRAEGPTGKLGKLLAQPWPLRCTTLSCSLHIHPTVLWSEGQHGKLSATARRTELRFK